MKQNYNSFWYQEGSWIQIRKILSDTTLIILERIMYLAMIWLLVEYWFQSHWSDGKHNAKVYGQWIKFDRQQVNINAYVRWSAIIVVQENIWIIFVTLIFCIDLYFLCEYFFIPLCHYFYSHHQGFSNRDTIIGHVNMHLLKAKNWHVSCFAEEKETFLRWFSSSVN